MKSSQIQQGATYADNAENHRIVVALETGRRISDCALTFRVTHRAPVTGSLPVGAVRETAVRHFAIWATSEVSQPAAK